MLNICLRYGLCIHEHFRVKYNHGKLGNINIVK